MSLSAEQRQRLAPLWERMLVHQLLETRAGTIADDTFARWMRQDYVFVEQDVHFVAPLLARAPRRHRDALAEAIDALRTLSGESWPGLEERA